MNNRGLTLVELMIASVLIILIIATVGSVFINGQNSFSYIEGSANNIQEARHGLDQISRDLRTATEITSASSTSITFIGNYDGNNATEAITYILSSGNINRTIGTLSKQIASGIVNTETNPVFSYFDQNATSIADGKLAKLIKVDLRVDKSPNKSPTRSTKLVSTIQLRNLHERR